MRAPRPLAGALLAAVVLTQSGCGTLIHPERSGQAPGRLDPSIVILDGIGLLFYFVPGLVAFAVDFSNNTIYLPGGASAANGHGDGADRVVTLDEPIDRTRLEAIVERETGVTDVLGHERLQVRAGAASR